MKNGEKGSRKYRLSFLHVCEASGVMERTLRLVALLRDAEEVKAPRGVPCEGKVVSDLDSGRRYFFIFARSRIVVIWVNLIKDFSLGRK